MGFFKKQLLEVIELHQNLSGEKAFDIAVEALKQVKIPDAEEKMKAKTAFHLERIS